MSSGPLGERGPLGRALCAILVVTLVSPTLATAQAPPTLAVPPGQAQSPAPAAPTAPGQPGATSTAPPGVAPSQLILTPFVNRVAPGPDYRLGPGDLLEVQIGGRVDVARHQVTVDPEGKIIVPPVGAMSVGGLTLLEAHRLVGQRARELFRFVDLTLTVLVPRTFEITVAGEVERPGVALAAATRRVHDVILGAGGLTPRGSLRRVTIGRDGRTEEVDLLRFELRGDLGQNPLVSEGMTIHVPAKRATVTLAGAVRRPGEYEFGPGGALSEVLELAGGVLPTAAAAQARLTRVNADGRRQTVSVDLTALAPPVDVTLRPGDQLLVPTGAQLQDLVEVRGAFNGTPESVRTSIGGKPTIVQRLDVAEGDRVRDVVARAGGPTAYADLRMALLERGPASGPRQRIPLDLQRLYVDRDETQNVPIENGDVLTLPPAEDKVFVLGEVRTPGPVDFRPELTPREYLALAGGPTVRARFKNATVTFRDGRTYRMAEAPPLEPGVVMTVPEVSVRWYQDYIQIVTAITGLITSYTSLFFLFGRNRND
jgi:protein involved in polysaccharide export with SLBB domain